MTQLLADPTIERLEAPSPEQFDEHYVKQRKPVILTGIASEWPAMSKWNADYLKSVGGKSIVSVHYDEDGDFRRWYSPDGLTDVQMPLEEFVDILQREPADHRYYLTEHSIKSIAPALLDDVDMSRYVDARDAFMFLGRDTMMPLHYHGTTEAVLCQIIGTKQIVLYPPEQSSLLYAHPWYSKHWHFSRIDKRDQALKFEDVGHLGVDTSDGNGSKFPRFGRATPITFTLHPGEILFIPVQWWHLTTCPGFQVNCTFFWRSEVKRYRFPNPGLQTLAQLAVQKVKRRLRRG